MCERIHPVEPSGNHPRLESQYLFCSATTDGNPRCVLCVLDYASSSPSPLLLCLDTTIAFPLIFFDFEAVRPHGVDGCRQQGGPRGCPLPAEIPSVSGATQQREWSCGTEPKPGGSWSMIPFQFSRSSNSVCFVSLTHFLPSPSCSPTSLDPSFAPMPVARC